MQKIKFKDLLYIQELRLGNQSFIMMEMLNEIK